MKLSDAIEAAETACGYSDAYRGDHIFNVVIASMEYCLSLTHEEVEAMITALHYARAQEKEEG